MTDYDKMEAGREMDALIAEKVMGWIWCVHVITSTPNRGECGKRYRFLGELERYGEWYQKWDGIQELPILPFHNEQDEDGYLPHYSDDIGEAWDVVEKMRELGFPVHIQATQHQYGVVGYRDILKDEWMWASTAPLAICRAALKALASTEQEEPKCPRCSQEAIPGYEILCLCPAEPQEQEGAGK